MLKKFQEPKLERDKEVVKLRKEGKSFREIGDKFKITGQRAFVIYKRLTRGV